ncbi:MAG TPA: hypothetical protein VLX91_16765 [Candidatus Acidoferrales bacterium]|nr:hypothetical protein [Candidatus Acidoferrales bacterium]
MRAKIVSHWATTILLIAVIMLISWALRPRSRTLGVLFPTAKGELGNTMNSMSTMKLKEDLGG